MKTYRMTFYGREAGALGVTYHITAMRTAETEQEAAKALYDEFEHIRTLTVEEVIS